MKIACISDTHGQWSKANYPQADVLIFAGDVLGNYNTCRGDAYEVHKQLIELHELNQFVNYLKATKGYKEVILISGNHDWVFQKDPQVARNIMTNITYLEDSSVYIGDVDGGLLRFYGSPWQPWFWDWAFNFRDHNADFFGARAEARGKWEQIPDDVDVLITHGPPHAIMDGCDDGRHVGCTWLRERLDELKSLKLHVFGHIHNSYGYKVIDCVQYVNASHCKEYNRRHEPKNAVRVVEI